MADSLVLVGVKDVRKHTNTEMQLMHPLRGGNTHQVKEWWRNGVNTTYTGCTIFRVTTAAGSVKLALATGKPEGAEVRIDHDGNFNFSFYHMNEIERAALFTDDMQIIEHYVFPSMSGGKIMTVTPAGAADRPTAGPPETIGTVLIAGNNNPTENDTGIHYVAAISGGTATDPTFQWSVVGDATITGGQGTQQATLSFGAAGNVSLGVIVAKEGAANTPQTDTFAITVAAAPPPPPATGPADSVTLVGNVTTLGAGSIAASATTSNNGAGLTVTYDSDGSGVASNLAIAAAGNGYEEGDSFTVDGDTGVTGTVSIAAILTANNAVVDVAHVVTQAGGYYYIDGVQQAEITANAGETIYFDLSDASLSGHPFKIYTDSTKTTEVTVGIEQQGTDLLFTPPISGSFSYQCSAHAGMGGDITIS